MEYLTEELQYEFQSTPLNTDGRDTLKIDVQLQTPTLIRLQGVSSRPSIRPSYRQLLIDNVKNPQCVLGVFLYHGVHKKDIGRKQNKTLLIVEYSAFRNEHKRQYEQREGYHENNIVR